MNAEKVAPSKRKNKLLFLVFVLLAVGLYAAPMLLFCLLDCEATFRPHATLVRYVTQKIPFDSKIWKNAKQDRNHPVRLLMLDDLQKTRHLVGMRRSQVVQILGESDPNAYGSYYGYQAGYWLSPPHDWIHFVIPGVMDIDSDWLCLKYEKDKVIEVSVKED